MTRNRIAVLAVMACSITLAITACTSTSASPEKANGAVKPTTSDQPAQNLDPATLAYLKSNADALAKQLDIANPPSVSPVRLITLQDYASTQIACLNEAGFAATETPDGEGISYPPIQDPGLKASLNLAIYTCELKYPTQQKYMTPLSTAALKSLYAYRTGELTRCLSKAGYTASERPPSEAVFVQSNGSWSPYETLSVSQNDVKRVFKACPQTPDSVYGH